MKSKFLISFLSLLVIISSSYGQLNFWESGTQNLDQACTKAGILGLLPSLRCQTLGGSASCKTNALGLGLCSCNQGSSAHVDRGDHYGKCVGLVGAVCTAEKPNFIPEKFCTPNAECVAEQGEGYSVGRCQCLYGFMEGEEVDNKGFCIPNPDVEVGDRSTPRPTTTTEAPVRGEFQLPPLNLLIGTQIVPFGQDCHTKALLKRTYCSTYGGTVSCLNRKCQCNMGENSVFDDELQMCVATVGSYCLTKRSLFGYKACTSGAHCVVDKGAGYTLGFCQCLDGYILQPNGKCMRDPDIPNPSTASPIVPPRVTATTVSGTSTTNPGDGSGAGEFSSGILIIAIMSVIAILHI
ncbi:unnamed protein product [Orchesella dallaii]|uniref:EB domain-containing protein n=1 Tax=Orchesella dallaii TaxID=48710 RepID=A0ABP1PS62_9HEXA